jgi:hypothetical protein
LAYRGVQCTDASRPIFCDVLAGYAIGELNIPGGVVALRCHVSEMVEEGRPGDYLKCCGCFHGMDDREGA